MAHSNPTKKAPVLGNRSRDQNGDPHTSSWASVPASWSPYVQLTRLSWFPNAVILIYFPHLIGALHAAITYNLSVHSIIRPSVILLIGSLFFSNAAHVWNDLIDAPIDAKIPRTAKRPIPRGAVSPQAAFLFGVSQALCAAACLLFLPKGTSAVTVPTIIGTTYYPFAKRHLPCPQVVLAFCLAWGIMVGHAAMGSTQPWRYASVMGLLIAVMLWVVIFDTIYAHLDLKDDKRVGVKSMAVWMGHYSRQWLWMLYLLMIAALGFSGQRMNAGGLYHLVAVGVGGGPIGMMLAMVDLRDSQSCWTWFAGIFWVTGAAFSGALVVEYASRQGGMGEIIREF